jgi:hypothetical protein
MTGLLLVGDIEEPWVVVVEYQRAIIETALLLDSRR